LRQRRCVLQRRRSYHRELSAARRASELVGVLRSDARIAEREVRASQVGRLFGDYLGVGAGAHDKFTAADGTVWRSAKPAHPLAFIEQAGRSESATAAQAVSARDLGFEFMLNALRLPEGFDDRQFAQRTGLPLSALARELGIAKDKGLLESVDGQKWKPTALGWQFLNDLQGEFLPA
jgi:oxygen-independent coproporphyrinogen-3 oxidase